LCLYTKLCSHCSKIEPSVVDDVKTSMQDAGSGASEENLTDSINGDKSEVSGLLPTKLSVIEDLQLFKKENSILTSELLGFVTFLAK
jgi:hypothetical protein